jgi:hypothetical protein
VTRSQVLRAIGAAAALVVLGACSTHQEGGGPVPTRVLVVLPFETMPSADKGEKRGEPQAGELVTAQLYRVLTTQTQYRFVPDLTVEETLATPELRRAVGQADLAVALAKAVGAEVVVTGRVNRFDHRVGTAEGATQGAAVAFEMSLYKASDPAPFWRSEYAASQDELGSNLFWDLVDEWILGEPKAHWLSASELAGRGVEELWEQASDTLTTEFPEVEAPQQPEASQADEPKKDDEDDGWFDW